GTRWPAENVERGGGAAEFVKLGRSGTCDQAAILRGGLLPRCPFRRSPIEIEYHVRRVEGAQRAGRLLCRCRRVNQRLQREIIPTDVERASSYVRAHRRTEDHDPRPIVARRGLNASELSHRFFPVEKHVLRARRERGRWVQLSKYPS